MKKKLKFFRINKILRLFLIFLMVVILVFSCFISYNTEKSQKYIIKKSPVYSYNNSAKVNYQVNLLPNQLYSEKYLKEGKTYLSNLVDDITTIFTYEFHGESPAKVKGTYNIHAVLEGYISGDKENTTLWKKDYELQPDTAFEGTKKDMSLQKKLPIDTKTYNDYVNKAIQATGCSFSTKLTFMWNVSAEIETEMGKKNENLTCSMDIPLSSKYFEVKGNLSQNNKGAFEKTIKEISPSYTKKLNLYRNLIAFSMVFIIMLLLFTKPKTGLNPIDKKRISIFKEHGSRMVSIYNNLETSSKTIIEVLSIDDLVRIADEIERPIFYNGSEKPKEIYNFYVSDEKEIYMLDIRRES